MLNPRMPSWTFLSGHAIPQLSSLPSLNISFSYLQLATDVANVSTKRLGVIAVESTQFSARPDDGNSRLGFGPQISMTSRDIKLVTMEMKHNEADLAVYS